MAKTWQVILATIAIFVAGLVTGGAMSLRMARWMHERRAHLQPPPPPAENPRGGEGPAPAQARPQPGGGFGAQLMRSFISQLDLTEEQRARVDPIVRRTAFELGQERREVQLKSALLIEKMQNEIASILTPEQRTRFEELIMKQRERLGRFRQAAAPQEAPPVQAPPPHQGPPN